VFAGADIRTIRTGSSTARECDRRTLDRTLRRECLDDVLITGPCHLTVLLQEYVEHYNTHRPHHRPHRTLGQAAPLRPLPEHTTTELQCVIRRDRPGGLIHEYQQVA
jgi:hypothetical protein